MTLTIFLLGVLRLVIRSAIFILVVNAVYSWVIFVSDQPIATEVAAVSTAASAGESTAPNTIIEEINTSSSSSGASIESDDSNYGSQIGISSCSNTIDYSSNSSFASSSDTANTTGDLFYSQVNPKIDSTTSALKPAEIHSDGVISSEATHAGGYFSTDFSTDVPRFATLIFSISEGETGSQDQFQPKEVEMNTRRVDMVSVEDVQTPINRRPVSKATLQPQARQVDPEEVQTPSAEKIKGFTGETESRKYRYGPQFLMQFSKIVDNPIDSRTLETAGLSFGRKPFHGPQNRNSSSNGQSQGGRFNGSSSTRPGQFYDRDSLSGPPGNSKHRPRRRTSKKKSRPVNKPLAKVDEAKKEKQYQVLPQQSLAELNPAPLISSANRWVPRSRAKTAEVKLAPDGSNLLSSTDIERKINSSLNKLTLEMFEPITDELLKISRQSVWEDDAQTLKQVVSLTFSKACDEPHWSPVYARFCAKMFKELPTDIKDMNTFTKTGEPATGGDLARRILLAICQTEYNRGWVDKLPTKEDGSPLEPVMMSDEYYIMASAKRRGLGLLKFIGNLFILNMLNDQVILGCLRDQSKNVVDPSEDCLENLAQLVSTVGSRLETSGRNKAALDKIYDNIHQILGNCKLSSRIKCLLMDLEDLRKNSWRSTKKNAGPKTIREIHEEAGLKKVNGGKKNGERRKKGKRNGANSRGFGGSSKSTTGSSFFSKNPKDIPNP
ncbi:hypothetical protein JCM33374_g630 [Metschnikowia sp. JCM 33374]|nr:hypothetical protein JCM33374_g630 [Metschnikowia sp. JCM 33374]